MLTARQAEALRYIANYQASHAGVSPTYREMSAAMGVRSRATSFRIIEVLQAKGLVRQHPHRARAIEILRMPEEVSDLRQAVIDAARALLASIVSENSRIALVGSKPLGELDVALAELDASAKDFCRPAPAHMEARA